MTIRTLLRSAALALGIAAALPAPASPQIGGFIKKKLKQTIERNIGGSDTASASAAAPAPATSTGSPSRVRKGTRESFGPTFSESMLEITPDLLDRLEKGLGAAVAERKAGEAKTAKFLSHDAYLKCTMTLGGSPEAKAAYREYVGMLKGSDMEAMRKASEWYGKRMGEIARPKCGPDPNEASEIRRQLRDRPDQVAQEVSGLNESQFSILKERIIPFCKAAGAAGTTVEGGYIYTAGEVEALPPRCAKLMAALG